MKPITQKPDLLAEEALERFRDIVLGWPLLCQTGFVRFIQEHQTAHAQNNALALRRDDWFLFPEIHHQLAEQALGSQFGTTNLNNGLLTPKFGASRLSQKLSERLQEPDGLAFGVRSLAALMTQSYRRSSHAHHHDHAGPPPDKRKPIEGHDLPDAYRMMLIDHVGTVLAKDPAVRQHLEQPDPATIAFLNRPDIQEGLNRFSRPVRQCLQTAFPILIAALRAEGQTLRQHPLSLPALAWHESRQASIIRDVLIQNRDDHKIAQQRPVIAAWHWIAGGVITAAAMLHLAGVPHPLARPAGATQTGLQDRAEQVERAGLWGGTIPLSAFYATSQQWDDLPRTLRQLEVPGGLLMGHLTTEMALAVGNVTNATREGIHERKPAKIGRAIADAYSDFALDILSDIYLTAQMTSLGMKTARLLRKRKNGLPESVRQGLDRADYAGIGIGVAFAFGGLAAVDGLMLEAVDKAVPWLLPTVVGTIYGAAGVDLAAQKSASIREWPRRIGHFCRRTFQRYGLALSTCVLAGCATLGSIVGFASPAGAPVIPDSPANTPPTTITQKPDAKAPAAAKAPPVHNIRVKPGNAMWTLLEENIPKIQKNAVTPQQIGNIVQQMQKKSNIDLIYPNETLRLAVTENGISITFRRDVFHVNHQGNDIAGPKTRHSDQINSQRNNIPATMPQMALGGR